MNETNAQAGERCHTQMSTMEKEIPSDREDYFAGEDFFAPKRFFTDQPATDNKETEVE